MQYIVQLFFKFSSLRNFNSSQLIVFSILVMSIFLPLSITNQKITFAAVKYQGAGQPYDDPNAEETSTYQNILDPDSDEEAESSSSVSSTESNKSDVLSGIGASTTASSSADEGVTGIIATIVNILSLIVGITAIIFIIFSGLKYITAAGDSAKISSAKSTLLYALVGLVVAALAKFMVDFVFSSV